MSGAAETARQSKTETKSCCDPDHHQRASSHHCGLDAPLRSRLAQWHRWQV